MNTRTFHKRRQKNRRRHMHLNVTLYKYEGALFYAIRPRGSSRRWFYA